MPCGEMETQVIRRDAVEDPVDIENTPWGLYK
jgi:hypothetical protein